MIYFRAMRRFFLAAVFSLITVTVVLAQQPAEPQNKRIRRVYLTVASVDRSLAFYRSVIGLQQHSQKQRLSEQISALHGVPAIAMDTAAVKLTGDSTLEFKEFLAQSEGQKPRSKKGEAIKFILEVRDLHSILQRLAAADVTYVGPEQTKTGMRVLVRDPDGILIELSEITPTTFTSTMSNLAGVRIRIPVKDTEVTTRFYKEAFSCIIQQQEWTAEGGLESRRSICEWPQGDPTLEFIQSRDGNGDISVLAIQDPGVVCFEVMVADSSYDDVVRTLQTSGAEPLVAGGPIVVISGRRSVMLRGPDSVFLQFRSFRAPQ